MVNFRVGDRVEVVNINGSVLEKGDIGVISILEGTVAKVRVNNRPTWGNWISVFDLKLLPTDEQRIESLEKRVEELEKIVGDYFKLPVEPSTEFSVYEGQDLAEQVKAEKTPNQLRAEIIEKAKGFVENEKGDFGTYPVMDKESPFPWYCKAEFIINEQKRTVVVLMRGVPSNTIYAKGIAKCNPSDVFNEHIGKAIALGRALGLDVSEFEGAVQPTHATGQVCEIKNWYRHNGNLATLKKPFKDKGFYHSYYDGWLGYENFKIINDTNAIYGEVE